MRGAGTRSRQSFGPGFELCVADRVKTAFEADLEAVELAMARRDRLDADIAGMAADSKFTAVVRNMCCVRGVSTLTGLALAVEMASGTGSPAPPSGPTSAGVQRALHTKLGPIWLLGLGVEERFVVVAAEQEGEPVEVAA